MDEDADDPIPIDVTTLVDAYLLTRAAHIPDWDKLVEGITPDGDDHWWSADLAERVVERHFRDALARGELTAYVHHPVTGERLKLLNRDHWNQQGQIPGITSNFTSPNDIFCPGPDSTLLGKRRPVVVITEELKRWLVPIGEPERKIPRKQEVGKRPLIKQYLSERFPIEKFPNGVPSPAFCSRNVLLLDIRDSGDPTLKQLDAATLKSAIDEYNVEIGANPK